MCGIAGCFDLAGRREFEPALLAAMSATLVHRGPDGHGEHLEPGLALAHRRLSIIDLVTGAQPLCNETGDLWITFNGEIFNYQELQAELRGHGHRLQTASDTEVIVHLYEELGEGCLDRLRGQFAFALWDRRRRRLFLARDRLGIRPLFYATQGGAFYFASEAKALLATELFPRALDPMGLDQSFFLNGPMPPRTAFRGISQLGPGQCLKVDADGTMRTRTYWDLDFPDAGARRPRPEAEYREELLARLEEATRLRLIADVPVGIYLSGGLDSSVVAQCVHRLGADLDAFSIEFTDRFHDEGSYSRLMAEHLGLRRKVVLADAEAISGAFPRFIWHSEVPAVPIESVPLLLLSGLAARDVKVVLTGEGSDELFAGYPWFQLTQVNRWLDRVPPLGALARALLGPRAGGFLLPGPGARTAVAAKLGGAFPAPLLIHRAMHAFVRPSYSGDLQQALGDYSPLDDLAALLPPQRWGRWHPLDQDLYVATRLLLANHLLAAHGDRVAMASSLEARYPFLDHPLVEFAATIAPELKLRGLQEKYILKATMRPHLPPAIVRRRKKPLTSPVTRVFWRPGAPAWVRELLSPASVATKGYFDPAQVAALVAALDALPSQPGRAPLRQALLGFRLAAVLSVQLLDELYVQRRTGLLAAAGASR